MKFLKKKKPKTMKMKNILTLALFILFIAPSLKAQEIITDEINYNQLEKFIQMAKDYYPQRKIADEQEMQAKTNVTLANLSYLDVLNVSYYWRPEDRQAINQDNPYITNGFQFSVNVSPSSLFSKPFQVKTAKSNRKIAELQKQAFDTELANQVKTRYYNYVLQLKDFKQKTIGAQTAKGAFLEMSNSFQRGEITLEEYNAGRIVVSESDYDRLQSEINFLRAKDELEAIIGSKLADIKN